MSLLIENVSAKLPWNRSIGRRRLSDIKYAIVHHDAQVAEKGDNAMERYKNEANYHIKKGWGHLSYTFKITREGKIYQTVPLDECGAHAGNYAYFKNSFGICLDGSFDKQSPSGEQTEALKQLMHHLSYERPDVPNLLRKGFYVHNEVRLLPTYCPGPVVKGIVVSFRKGLA